MNIMQSGYIGISPLGFGWCNGKYGSCKDVKYGVCSGQYTTTCNQDFGICHYTKTC